MKVEIILENKSGNECRYESFSLIAIGKSKKQYVSFFCLGFILA